MAADLTYPNVVQTRQDGNMAVPTGKSIDIESGGAFKVAGTDITAALAALGAAGKIKVGQATTVTAADTIATGLTTVTAAFAVLNDDPVVGCEAATANPGDQAGAPAAGSILLNTWKTLGGTPAAATTFSKKVSWLAVGT